MNEWLILLWIFAAAIVAGAVIALVASAAAIAEGVFLDTRAAYRRRRRCARRARLERRVSRGERAVVRDLSQARDAARRHDVLKPAPGGVLPGSAPGQDPHPFLAASPGTVLRFERDRAGLLAVADATHEERT